MIFESGGYGNEQLMQFKLHCGVVKKDMVGGIQKKIFEKTRFFEKKFSLQSCKNRCFFDLFS